MSAADRITGSDVVLDELMRPVTALCLEVLTRLQRNLQPDPTSVGNAIRGCEFLLGLPFKKPHVLKTGLDVIADFESDRQVSWMGTRAETLGRDVMTHVFRYVSNAHSDDLGDRREGQRFMQEATLVNRQWHSIGNQLLWRDPVVKDFSELLRLALGMKRSCRFSDSEGNGVGVEVGVGSTVRRLNLPPCPSWSIGGPPLCSKLVLDLTGSCRGLRTLKMDKNGDPIDLPSLAVVFRNCPNLVALRLSLTLDPDVEDKDEEEEEEEQYDADAMDTGVQYQNEPVPSDPALYDAVTTGISRLEILDMASLSSSHRPATLAFLDAVEKGISSSTSLRRCHLQAFAHDAAALTNVSDVGTFITALTHRCKSLQVLHIVLPDFKHDHWALMSMHVHMYTLNRSLEELARGCPNLRILGIRTEIRQLKPAALPNNLDHTSPIFLLRSTLVQLVRNLRNLTQLDLQGLGPCAHVVECLTREAPRSLQTVLIDTDHCPSPVLVRFIRHRGPLLRSISLLSVLTLPTDRTLDEVARSCGRLRHVDLRHKPPSVTEDPTIARFPFPEQWIAALRRVLSLSLSLPTSTTEGGVGGGDGDGRIGGRLERCDLSWIPPCPYSDPTFDLDQEFGSVIRWIDFPETVETLTELAYPA
ncbi:hypothetical protein HKX48_007239, partial [Thoreauomyces humboldtii]